MTEDRVPPVVESLIRAVAGGSGEDREERASTFARGLALGALVGAAIAGSTIWQRRVAREHARAAALELEPGPGFEPEPEPEMAASDGAGAVLADEPVPTQD